MNKIFNLVESTAQVAKNSVIQYKSCVDKSAKIHLPKFALTKREGNKKRKELINLSTYTLINFKSAFTLSEVLITLGIIGIVAAMTIPTLIANTQGSKYRNQYKKTLSTLNQAVKMNEANYDFNFNSAGQACNRTDNPDSIMSVCAIFNGSLSGVTIFDHMQLKTPKNTLYYQDLYYKGTTSDTEIKNYGANVDLYYYQLKDGSFFAFHSPTTNCTLGTKTIDEVMQDENFLRYCFGWIDVNGVSLPNREVRCKDSKSHTKDISVNCIVPNSPKYIADVFPVIFYDGTVSPGSAAARYVLNTAK